MAIFIVTYEPRPKEPTVQELDEALKPIAAAIRIMRGAWLLRSDVNPMWLLTAINDRLGKVGLLLAVVKIAQNGGEPEIAFDELYIERLAMWDFVSTR